MPATIRGLVFLFAFGPLAAGAAHAVEPVPGGAADVTNNFGLPLGFSVVKMDRKADPRQDFIRYAAGGWLEVAQIPGDSPYISGIVVMIKKVEKQVHALLTAAAARSPKAARGTPLQQVGDFYAAGMDVQRLDRLGAAPIKAEWDRIAAIDSPPALAEALARLSLSLNDPVVIGAAVDPDARDTARYAVFVSDGMLPMPASEDYLSPDLATTREAYRAMVIELHRLAGLAPEQARARAATVLEMETRLAAKRMTPVQRLDPNALMTRLSYAELKQLLSNVDVDTYFRTCGLPTGGEVIAIDVGALRERNAMLADYSLEDTKIYLQWEWLRHTANYLTPAFVAAVGSLTRTLYGQAELPTREQVVAAEVATRLGHPLGRLYVEQYFPAAYKARAEDLVGRIRQAFRSRLEHNDWLSAPTREYALQKLDKIAIVVAYPEQWIDYSSVDVRRDDYLGNMLRLNEFAVRRDLAKLGQPVHEDGFDDPRATLPTVVNAAYAPEHNGIEIPAAFLQPPFFDPRADAAVNFCTLGAVIGHEITHGFDSQGRLYDADGNVRDWWAPADGAAFVTRAQPLVEQASAYEVLPGVSLNGRLSVGENLADVGGLMLGYEALQEYLAAHPKENRIIDGLTPAQRCFIAWAQNWADKMNDTLLRQLALSDPHPPGAYRTVAPAQNLPGFYDAFGIQAGDRMWRAPQARVAVW